MKLTLTDKRKFNYIMLTLLAMIVIFGVIQMTIDIKVLPIE
ncbi:MAG: hypothetical protein ACYDBW_01130 [Sulfuricaulis sp.]